MIAIRVGGHAESTTNPLDHCPLPLPLLENVPNRYLEP